MIAAKVIDNIWATRKADSLRGLKFMLVEVLGGIDKGRLIIAADTISAGIGERVLVCTGSSARRMLGQDDIPIDAVIVGIIDEDCTF
ncbi:MULTISPECIES: EutN/CcmL family microcompartment protein [Desulfitobacterium]|uniref:Carbon dioxide concentrating mechanism/carboxysome shell protein n=2 Tax=Desulfitobacterium dehalogenans TaxID=36854 RepID=I4AER6_DESDJ|nr:MULTISPECIES: EutN/CcmL family microcompartment protein [Desulfitobacterium]AFM02451.1 carbon dioxide concentrating mechanism/carboxysome shell protein [Desulfitobacterium dehalogenans ATCC 51507]HHY28662.1 EutN/CcmL family microcompartment protein [Desulfitobacterium dehalogenans]